MHSTVHCIHLFQKKDRDARHNRYDLVEQVGIEVVEYDEVEEVDRIFQEPKVPQKVGYRYVQSRGSQSKLK